MLLVTLLAPKKTDCVPWDIHNSLSLSPHANDSMHLLPDRVRLKNKLVYLTWTGHFFALWSMSLPVQLFQSMKIMKKSTIVTKDSLNMSTRVYRFNLSTHWQAYWKTAAKSFLFHVSTPPKAAFKILLHITSPHLHVPMPPASTPTRPKCRRIYSSPSLSCMKCAISSSRSLLHKIGRCVLGR